MPSRALAPSRVAELLFFDSGPSSVDPDVLSYLATFDLDDEDDDCHEQALQDIQETCASASREFAALPEAERTRRVIALLDALSGGGGADGATAATTGAAAATTGDAADAAAAAAAAALAAALEDLGGSGISDAKDARARAADEDEEEHKAEEEDAATAAAADALADLLVAAAPGSVERADARGFAAHVLRERCSGDAEAAGEHLLSLADDDGGGKGLAAAVAEWRLRVRARKEAAAGERLARERGRQATLDLFAWRPESTGGGGGGGGGGGWGGAGKPPPPEVLGGGSKKAAAGVSGGDGGKKRPARTIRFLDGVPVATSEKYVVVSQKEEWDGGSRGRVKTKGKRGVGFA